MGRYAPYTTKKGALSQRPFTNHKNQNKPIREIIINPNTHAQALALSGVCSTCMAACSCRAAAK